MGTWQRFPNAPIVEALVDISVTFAAPIEPERLAAFQDAIRDRYPIKQSRVRWHGEIQVAKEAVQQAVQREAEGFMFKTPDGQRIVQARQDGYTFNWLKPYDRWESLRDEAHSHWERYRDVFRPEAITRLGLRYINRIELPLPFKDFRDFVKTAPDIAPGLPQGVTSLLMRLEIPDPNRGLVAIITETIEAPSDKDRLPFIFDIDIVRQSTFEPSSAAVWETLEQMRDYKNEIFFSSVTDRARELFR